MPSPGEMEMILAQMLTQMESNFTTMSTQMLGKIDQMAARIDELEETVQDLMARAGVTEEDVLKAQEERRAAKAEKAQGH